MKVNEKWLEWAVEIQAIAQAGLYYSDIDFDIERFERLREIANEMIEYKSEIPLNKIKEIFSSETGYQTPKLATKAVIFKDNKILMVQENTGIWTLPGGWCDVDRSLVENTIKEAKEEAGIDVEVDYIIGITYSGKDKRIDALKITTAFLKCNYLGGEFKKNIETIDSNYFSFEELQDINIGKVSMRQLKMCFDANESDDWKVVLD